MLAFHLNSKDLNIKKAIKYIKSRGLTERDMWYFKFGISSSFEFKDRVIMPSFDSSGKLNYYTGRAIDPNAYRKYMNSDADKKQIIFNEINIDWKKEVTLVEGPFDLTKCDENAVPLLGSSLTDTSLLFQRIYENKTPVLLALDLDMEHKEWQRIAKMLNYYDIKVRIMDVRPFEDVGEMSKQQFLSHKKNAAFWNANDALRKKIQGAFS